MSWPLHGNIDRAAYASQALAMLPWRQSLALVVLLLVMAAGVSLAQSLPASQTIEGVAPIIQRNQARARQKAVHDSWYKALEQTVADLLDVETLVARRQVLQTKIYARAPRYIRSYRVLWEYPDVTHKVYRVGIEAEVDVKALTQAIARLGLTLTGGAAPRLLLLLGERHQQPASVMVEGRARRVMTEVLHDQLQAQRFRLVQLDATTPWDGQETSALVAGRTAGADVVLVGWADVQKIQRLVADVSLQTVQATAQVGAWVTATGKQLTLERAQAAADHADATLGGRQAVEKATSELVTQLVPILRAYQQAQTDRVQIAPASP